MFIFTWSAISNQTYQIQYTADLSHTNWLALGGNVTATNATMTTADSLSGSQKFYRIVLAR